VGDQDQEISQMADPKNPFGNSDDERTIIRPNPGRRAAQQFRPPQSEIPPSESASVDLAKMSGLNPLDTAASLLLNLLGQIRNTTSHPDPDGLHRQLEAEIRSFESRAQNAGLSPETVFTARYILCTTIDEFILSTPWGANSVFRNQSLLRIFHQERLGGEKFFQLLDNMIRDPARNIDLLELMYVCLALGFQGRYRVESDGTNTLEAIRENLYRTIRNQRGDIEHALSPNWEGIDHSLQGRKVRIPLWALITIVLAVLAFIFVGLTFGLNRSSEPLYAALSTTGTEENLLPHRIVSPTPVRRIADPTPERFSLKIFLAPEIERGEVSVDEQPDKTIVLIHGDGLFDSGVDVVRPAYLPVLARIGEGLEQTRGRIEVTGHSDNVPISTRRFPSNQSLSQARAEEVVRMLSEVVSDDARMRALGMADRKPIAPNETAEGRALNRRVEISVYERARGG
jgi:type VI secretion system protein ImpK